MSFITINVQAGTVTASRTGFGIPLLLGYHTRTANNVDTYTGLSGMLSDGFTVNDPMYLMAAAVFSQSPRPQQIKLGRLPAPATPHTVELDTTGIVSGQSVTGTIRDHLGNTTAISVPFDTDAATTATNLASAIDAITGIAASAATNVVTADVDSNGPVWFYEDFANVSIQDVTADWAYDTQLGTILNEDADFYGVAIDVCSPANISDVAAWVNTNNRLFVAAPQYTDPADYTATADALSSGDNDRVASLVTKNSRRQFPGAAFLGVMLPKDPGSATWEFKSLSGVTVSNWTASEIVTLEADNSLYYITQRGIPMSQGGGVTHGGEYLDVTRGLDWFRSRLEERLVTLLANNDKIPLTDAGGEIIQSEIEAQCQDAINQDVFASTVVTRTLVANLSSTDRANRIFSGFEIQAVLAGAVHSIVINLTVSA